jgi:tetratricopeptide (TPR) repeat protein
VAQVEEFNPHCGQFYCTAGATFDLMRKYPHAAACFELAIKRMPQLIESHGALGMVYMRLGSEPEAHKLLNESFEVDPFNVRVANSLKVLEVLDDYAVLETEHFVLRFDRVKDGLLARYMARYLEDEVYPQHVKQFGYEPKEKSLFEIFNRARNTRGHGWFSARMVGLPYVGTVGACAGKIVALASPGDMPQRYNWARVLKHEFVHVLNLQQTNFNIPHWYTEALAVNSEGYPRPPSWNEMLLERVPANKMFNLETINLGFVRPKSSNDWQMAYCQAQLYAEYMLKTYGDDALAKMLACYADNLGTRAALRRSFDVEQEDFEKGYRKYVDELVKELAAGRGHRAEALKLPDLVRAQKEKPDDPDLAAQLALACKGRAIPRHASWPSMRSSKSPSTRKPPWCWPACEWSLATTTQPWPCSGQPSTWSIPKPIRCACWPISTTRPSATPTRKSCMNWGPKPGATTCSGPRRWPAC